MKKNLLAIIFASFCAGTLSAQNIAWPEVTTEAKPGARWWCCLLYTSDAADD